MMQCGVSTLVDLAIGSGSGTSTTTVELERLALRFVLDKPVIPRHKVPPTF